MGMGMAVHTDTREKNVFHSCNPLPSSATLPASSKGPCPTLGWLLLAHPPIIQVPFLSYGHQVSLWSCEFWAWEARVV